MFLFFLGSFFDIDQSGFPNVVSLSPVFMGSSDLLNLLFAAGVWFTAYIAVAILSSFRIFGSLCSVWIGTNYPVLKNYHGLRAACNWPCRQWKGDLPRLTPYLCYDTEHIPSCYSGILILALSFLGLLIWAFIRKFQSLACLWTELLFII